MTVFLSPSAKNYIKSKNGKTEAEYTSILAENIESTLKTEGINVFKSPPLSTPTEAAICSNDKNIDLHIALSTLCSPTRNERGIRIFYPSNDARSRDRAKVFSEKLKMIYPIPEKVEIAPNCSFIELEKTNAPAVFISICNINNESDIKWFEENMSKIAKCFNLK